MKYFFICISLLISILSHSQDIVIYKDTSNNFSIGVPIGWRYGLSKNFPSIKIIAQQTTPDSSDKLLVNYNLNIYNSSNSTFENAYDDFILSINKAKNFKIIDSGNTVINGINYKWIIETHENNLSPINMCDYVLMTYKDRICYILTLVAPEKKFEKYKPLFNKIAYSLIL